MDEQLTRTMLFDLYGELLTKKQREYFHLHYNEDLSLAEIAEHEGITRQGVRDSIKRGEAMLHEMEDALHLVARVTDYERRLADIRDIAMEIGAYNNKNVYSRYLTEQLNRILTLSDSEQGD